MDQRVYESRVRAGRTIRVPADACCFLRFRPDHGTEQSVPLPPRSVWTAPSDGVVRLTVWTWGVQGAEPPAQLDTGGKIASAAETRDFSATRGSRRGEAE